MGKSKKKRKVLLKVKIAARRTERDERKEKSRRPSRRKSEKRDVRVKTAEDRLCWKLVGVALLALAVFTAAALASYNWECVASLAKKAKPQTNLIGACGNLFAYGGYSAFGLAIWCLPLGLLVGGFKLLESIPREVEEISNWRVALRVSGLALMTLVITGLFQLAGKWDWVQHIMADLHIGKDAGGWLGRVYMTNGLEKGVAAFGATFLSLMLLSVAMCMALGLSTLRKLFDWHLGEWDWSWLGGEDRAEEEDVVPDQKKDAQRDPKPDPELRTEEPPSPAVVKKTRPKRSKAKYPVSAELPPLSLLDPPRPKVESESNAAEMGRVITEKLREFKKVNATLVDVVEGPTVTQFALKPGHGVKVETITKLANDIQLALKAKSLRIFSPVPGMDAIGIQVSNAKPQTVFFREIVESEKWQQLATWPKDGSPKYPVPILLGKDVNGESVIADLVNMPHLLVAGASGKGKSVCLNSIINGMLMTRTPEQLRMILVDPKRMEFNNYKTMPHLLVPVVVEAKKVVGALRWAANEMDARLVKFSAVNARNIIEYNEISAEKVPYIVIVIDELGEVMSQCGRDVEQVLGRLMALARATGIHLIIATQRPDVKVISGTIKANIPGRVALGTSNAADSRTILDAAGAEKLCTKGDMIYKADDGLIRTQGAFISKGEMERIMEFVVKQWPAQFDESVVDEMTKAEVDDEETGPVGEDGITDEEYHRAYDIIVEANRASASMLQQRMGIGYNHASRIMHLFEKRGVIGPARGAGPREVLVNR